MGILKNQSDVSPQRGMPIETMDDSQRVEDISGETVQLQYWNSGTLTNDAGEAAGTVVYGKLAQAVVLNDVKDTLATNNSTSLTFTSTALTTERALPDGYDAHDFSTSKARATAITDGFANGEYCVDYAHGAIYGIKASTTTTLTSTAYSIPVRGGSSAVTIGAVDNNETIADDAAFTAGTSKVFPVGFVADETGTDSVDEDDIGAARMSLDRRVLTDSNLQIANADAAGGLGAATAQTLRTAEATDSALTLVATLISTSVAVMDDWDAVHDSAIGSDGAAVMMEAKDIDGSAFPNEVNAEGDAVRPAASRQGVQYVTLVNDDGSQQVLERLQTAFDSDADNSVQTVKASAGSLYGLEVSNVNTGDVFVQIFDESGAITVGTTTPKLSIHIPNGDGTNAGSKSLDWPAGIIFSNSIKYAVTTTATGSSDPTTGAVANFMFK